jgi:protein TonB
MRIVSGVPRRFIQAAKRMTSTYYSRSGPDTLNWGRVCGIAFAVTVQASLFMMLLVPPSLQDTSKDENEVHAATIIEPPPPPPPPPPTPPKEIPKIIPKEVPPPPQHINAPPPPLPPPVITDNPTPMSVAPPPPSPPAPPAPAVTMEASVDNSFKSMHPPEYPREALANGITGTVILRVTVSADGEPTKVEVQKSSRDRSLDRAAIEAAQKWKFNPKEENGKRVEGVVLVPVTFNL